MLFITILALKYIFRFSLVENHQGVIKARDGAVLISDSSRDLFQRNADLVVHPCDVVRLGIRFPRLWAIDVLKPEIRPQRLSLAYDYGKSLEVALGASGY